MTRAASRPRPTRIQREKTEAILAAALDVFATHGFRGATLDQIAEAAGLSKPNLLYWFASKEEVHRMLLAGCSTPGSSRCATSTPTATRSPRSSATSAARSRWPATIRARAGCSPARSCRARRTSATARGRAARARRRQGAGDRRLGRGRPHRAGRPAPPDLLDLGRDPALRRLRRPGPRRARRPTTATRFDDAADFLTGLYARALAPGATGLTVRQLRRIAAPPIRRMLVKV